MHQRRMLMTCLLGTVAVSAHGALVDVDRVALINGDAPGVAGSFSDFHDYDLNDNDELAFIASTSDGSSHVFSQAGGTVAPIASEGDSAPGGGEYNFQWTVRPSDFQLFLSNGGTTGFDAGLDGTGELSPPKGTYTGAGGSIELVAREDEIQTIAGRDLLINTLGGTRFNDAGRVALRSSFDDVDAGFRPSSAILSGSPDSLNVVAEDDTGADGLAGIEYDGFALPDLNEDGETAYRARLDGPGVDFTNDEAIYLQRFTAFSFFPVLVARTGEIAPGTGGARFAELDAAPVAGADETAFRATLTGSGVDPSNDEAIFVGGSASSLQLIAREGQMLPDGSVLGAPGEPVINEAGEVVFRSGLDGVSNAVVLKGSTGGPLEVLARRGDVAAGSGDRQFLFFAKPHINDAGETMIQAALGPGPGDKAIYVAGVDDIVRKFLVGGDRVDLTDVGLGERVIADFGLLTATPFTKSFNDNGTIAVDLAFLGGERGLFTGVATDLPDSPTEPPTGVPAPQTLLIYLSGLALLAVRCRRVRQAPA